jgi:Uma2 family endonuclease
MASVLEGHDTCVWLSGIPWEDYVRLRNVPESRNVRMTYDGGVLALMSPSKLHERVAELLGRLILAWTEERGIPVQSCGTMTFQRADLEQGLEPDKCYYVRHEAAVRAREELDLTVDPPPDLVVEVDVSSSSRDRLPLYERLGVPEVWLWRDDVLRLLVLDEKRRYVEADDSVALPGFPRPTAERLLAARREQDETALVREFREAIRSGA